jgi:hypothetical protein
MSNGLKAAIELFVLALIAALLVAAGAYVTHAVDAKKIATLQASYANQESERNKQLLSDYATAVQQRDAMQKSADAAALDAANKLKVANDETEKLRTCVNSGNGCGLRVHVVTRIVASASGAAMPEAASDSAAGYAFLAPDAGSAYFALRSAINAVEAQLTACKAYARQMQ